MLVVVVVGVILTHQMQTKNKGWFRRRAKVLKSKHTQNRTAAGSTRQDRRIGRYTLFLLLCWMSMGT